MKVIPLLTAKDLPTILSLLRKGLIEIEGNEIRLTKTGKKLTESKNE